MAEIIVNRETYPVSSEQESLSLLDFLREELDLTGTKNGCEEGTCGACTVLLEGRAVRACRTAMKKAVGKSVLTIEGIKGKNGGLHPLQQAFIDAGAVQCGFCTPGMIMQALDLLNKNPSPSREEIRKAMRGNLCRCTGYQTIIDAVEAAAASLASSMEFSEFK
jgi:aerobic carbon-monoxide dehydrogenase small subunit